MRPLLESTTCPFCRNLSIAGTVDAKESGMNEASTTSQLDCLVTLADGEVTAEIHDRRPDSPMIFGELDPFQRERLAMDAWAIGLRALQNAHMAAQESKLKDIGEALMEGLERQLSAHAQDHQERLTGALKRYFDPTDGQLAERLASFVDDQGSVARLLAAYVGPDSIMVAELTRRIGESSAIFRMLDPAATEGVVNAIETQVRAALHDGREEMKRALDPLAPEGAVTRFLQSLRKEFQNADQDVQKRLAIALRALDANNKDSLMSRLVDESAQARRQMLDAMNPGRPGSPLATLQTTIEKLIGDHVQKQTHFAEQQQVRQTAFEKEVREALARMETRKSEALRTARGGRDFEDAAMDFVERVTRGLACTFEATGSTKGVVGSSKKGDGLVRFTDESAYAGAGVVFEAKRERGYSVVKALEELDAARQNRDASAGVFEMAESHKPIGFPAFARYGNNVVVAWNEEDPATDMRLEAAILLGSALATRSRTVGDEGDINALRGIEKRITDEIHRLEGMEKSCDSIRKGADSISDELRKARKKLAVLLRDSQKTLTALKVELTDEAAERDTPIGFQIGSCSEIGGEL